MKLFETTLSDGNRIEVDDLNTIKLFDCADNLILSNQVKELSSKNILESVEEYVSYQALSQLEETLLMINVERARDILYENEEDILFDKIISINYKPVKVLFLKNSILATDNALIGVRPAPKYTHDLKLCQLRYYTAIRRVVEDCLGLILSGDKFESILKSLNFFEEVANGCSTDIIYKSDNILITNSNMLMLPEMEDIKIFESFESQSILPKLLELVPYEDIKDEIDTILNLGGK